MSTSFETQFNRIWVYQIGKEEGAEVLVGGEAQKHGGQPWILHQPTILKGDNKMRCSKRRFWSVVSLTTFKTTEEAIEIANDTIYGLGRSLDT